LDVLAESASLFSKSTAARTLEAIFNPGKVSGSISVLDVLIYPLHWGIQGIQHFNHAVIRVRTASHFAR
jgi:hypothetical protein